MTQTRPCIEMIQLLLYQINWPASLDLESASVGTGPSSNPILLQFRENCLCFFIRDAYHFTEKSGWGIENIMVSDLPVYRRNTTSVTVWIQKKGRIWIAWVWNREGTEKLVNGKQHFVWFVPTGMKGLLQNALLNFR